MAKKIKPKVNGVTPKRDAVRRASRERRIGDLAPGFLSKLEALNLARPAEYGPGGRIGKS